MASTYVHKSCAGRRRIGRERTTGQFHTSNRMIGPLFCLAPALEPPQFSRCSTRWRRKRRHAKFGGYTERAVETTTRLRRSHVISCKRCRTAAVE